MTAVLRELGPGETHRAVGALRELRPHLADPEALVRLVDGTLRPQGYRLLAAFTDPEAAADRDQPAPAVAGWRVVEMLAHGRFLYVDDLSTLPGARRRGLARELLAGLADEGRRLGCAALQLDSGVGPERRDAHALYLADGMRITSFHFARPLTE